MEILESIISTTGSNSLCFIIKEKEKSIFYKTWKKETKKTIRRIEHVFFNYFRRKVPIDNHLRLTDNVEKLIEKELATLQLWRENGIEVPNLIEKKNKGISHEFIQESITYKELLNKKYSPNEFDKFLESYDYIRKIANKEKNLDLLHSDPHLGNFLYDKNKDKAIPIDPGSLLNPRMSLEQLDTNLIAFTLRSIYNLKIDKKEINNYVSQFKKILSKKDIENIIGLDYSIPKFSELYFKFREPFAYRLKKRKKGGALKEYHNLIDNYNGFKEILMK